MAIKKVSQNLIWSWWIQPLAQIEPSTDAVIFSGVTSNGSPRVFRQHEGEDYTSVEYHHLFDGIEADDHNAPSTLVASGKDVISFWARHGLSSTLNYWKAPEGTFNFGTKKTITFPAGVTYNQSITHGDTIYTFVRIGGSQWYYIKSDDWGDTWTTPAMFFDGSSIGGQHYCLFQSYDNDPTKYHVVVYGHPTSSTWRQAIHGTIDVTTGEISNFSGSVANLDGTNLPITHGSLDVAYSPPSPNTRGERIRLFDVANKHGKNALLYGKWNDETSIPQYYVAVEDPSTGEWTEKKYFTSGGVFDTGVGRQYTYGMSFDRNDDSFIYIAHKDKNEYRLERWRLTEDYGLYDKYIIQTNSTYPLARPIPVRGKDAVIWQELRKYNGFTDYTSHVWIEE
jgi:hypothetical protein